LRFAGGNVDFIFLTGFEIIVEFTSINIGEFWFPCVKILNEFPGVNINTRFARHNSYDIGFNVLSGDEGGAVGKGSSDEENVKLHYDLKGPAFKIDCRVE